MQDISYTLDNTLYLNITNRCTNACFFCIRYKTHKFHGKYSLWLEREPLTDDVIKAIGDPNQYDQIVFCGYGESLIRLNAVKEICSWIKSQSSTRPLSPSLNKRGGNPSIAREGVSLRVDTNGQMNLFYGRNILPELKGLIDIMSISLNTEKAESYNAICNSFFGLKAYGEVLSFIKEAKKYIPYVEASVVNLPNQVNIEEAKKIAEDIGVKLRVRTYYEEKYVP
ncbi:radical SAM protein [Candidatus Saganbacteria bacterium]|nr:radical SAM protein [Candidatus Saganbacteria bacterium]